MATLTQEELKAIEKPPDEVVYHDHRVLITALEKLRSSEDKQRIIVAQIRLALALERSRVPHEEKANHWHEAGLVAESHSVACAMFFAKAADHTARDGSNGKAAKLFEKAAEYAISEGLDRNQIQALLREARRMYDLSGNSAEAGRLFQRENDFVRGTAPYAIKAWMHFFKLISAYGESPARVAGTACVLVIICAISYSVLGLHSNLTNQSTHSLATSLYFSIVTFTTLGYGDYSPTTGVARVVATFEALSGLFLMSLFLVTLVRRFGRS